MTVSNHEGLYAVVRPGNRRSSWSFRIFRDQYEQNDRGENKIWADTGVQTYGDATSQARAEKKARKRIAKMVKAYDMLARKESTVE